MRSASAKISSRSSEISSTAAPARARVEQLLLHVGDRADVEPPGRLVRRRSAPAARGRRDRRASSARPRISFCMLPPDSERAGDVAGRRRARRSARTMSRACARAARAAHDGPRENAALRSRSDDRVLPHRQVADHADRVPVLGDARDAGGDQPRAAIAAAARPASVHRAAASARARAAQQLGERLLAVARHAGDRRRSRRRAASSDTSCEPVAAAARACARGRSTQTASPTCARGARRTGASTAWPTIHRASCALRRLARRAPRPPACRRAAPRCDPTRAAPRRACG